jgi:hypothetical protein
LETGLYSDLEIVVNGESIRAHKAVLRARSEKFQVMLFSNYQSTADFDPIFKPSF